MPQQVQELINKIKSEGIEEAQKKAKDIETKAQQEALEIIAKAKAQANQLIKDAEEKIEKSKESAEKSIKQSARDTLLDLRRTIESVLNTIVLENVGQALSAGQMDGIIENIIDKYLDKKESHASVKITVSAADLEKVRKGCVAKLQHKLKNGIELSSADDIAHGFMISFDGGKSAFDFTDASLAQYLGAYLNPEIADLIKNVTAK